MNTTTLSLTLTERIRQEVIEIFRLGMPVVIAQLLFMSMQTVDTIMSGNYSAKDLAAVAVAGSIFFPVFIFSVGILASVNPIIAQFFGAGNIKPIGRTVRQALWLSQFLAAISILALSHAEIVLHFMEIEPAVIPLAQGYLDAICWGIPAAIAFFALRPFHEGLGITKPIMYFHIVGLAMNIFGNYTFIYGHFGFPEMGAVGTGWATALVHWSLLICTVIYTLMTPEFRKYRVFQAFEWPRWPEVQEMLHIGIPVGLSLVMEAGLFSVVALFMGSISVNVMAGHQIALNVAATTFMIPLGLSVAITTRVGQAIGRKEPKAAQFSGFTGITLCGGIMMCTAGVMSVFAEQITTLYTQDSHVQLVAIQLLYMAAIFQIPDGLQVAGASALRGLKDTRIPLLANIFAYWMVGLVLAYSLGFIWDYGPKGMWVGLIAGLVVAALFHNLRFRYLSRRLLAL